MIDSRHFVKVIDAIGLLQGSKYWKPKDQEGMKKWFSDFLHWMQTSPIGMDEMDAPNNHGAWYDAQRLSMALFTGKKELAEQIVTSARNRLDKQMNDEGKFPKEMERTISLHYSTFVMNAFFTIAQMAEETGMDLWNYSTPGGRSLQKGFDMLRPYLTRRKEWEGQQIKPFEYEDGYLILLQGSDKYRCASCREEVESMAGEKFERMRLNLLY